MRDTILLIPLASSGSLISVVKYDSHGIKSKKVQDYRNESVDTKDSSNQSQVSTAETEQKIYTSRQKQAF